MAGINLTSLTQNTSSPSYTGSNVLLLGNNNLQFQSFPPGDSNFMLASVNLADSIVNADLAAMNFSLGLVNQLRLENFQGGGHAVFIPAGSGPAGGMLGGVAIWNDGLHLRTIGSDGNTQTLLTPFTGASVELAQFRAIATGAQPFSTGPYPVSSKVVFSTVVEDNLSGFNAGSSSYTIPQSGFYHIGSEVSIIGQYDSSTLSLLINGTGVSLGTLASQGAALGENAPTNMVSSTVMELSSGDVLSSEVSINVFGGLGGPVTGSFLGQYNGQTYYADLWASQQGSTMAAFTGPTGTSIAGPTGPAGPSPSVALGQSNAGFIVFVTATGSTLYNTGASMSPGGVVSTANPRFMAAVETPIPNATGNDVGYQPIIFDTLVGPQVGSAFDLASSVFTAPVTGFYFLSFTVALTNLTSGQTNGFMEISISSPAGSQQCNFNPYQLASGGSTVANVQTSSIFFMNAGAQATCGVIVAGDSQTVTVGTSGLYSTTFTGYQLP